MAKSRQYVYFFGGGKAQGNASMKQILGGKGANLAEMAAIGLPVPPGFTIATEVCDLYYKIGKQKAYDLIRDQVAKNLKKLEKETGKTFGSGPNPLLLSVRSGAAQSMPGMMDTVLNLGINEETIKALIEMSGDRRFAMDAYRRFIQMFGDVVMGVEHDHFEEILTKTREKYGRASDPELTADELEELIQGYKKVYKRDTGEDFPQDPADQLWKGIDAVFGSWNTPRAIRYRELNDIRGLLGTAVNVQTMVFGNMGDGCATGVAFTRDPSTGANKYFYGEYLLNAQGEDVVAGTRTPREISRQGSREWAAARGMNEQDRKAQFPSLQEVMPKAFKTLDQIRVKLEKHYHDMQDVEFTIEKDTLYMLQTRTGKRTAAAHVKIAVDMFKEGLISEEESVLRVPPDALDQLLHPVFEGESEQKAKQLAKGLPASPGAATGRVVFTADEAEEWVGKGEKVILCRTETSPEDIGGMAAAQGILTSRGGMTSHAAVVARGMGTCCVAGCGEIIMDYKAKSFRAGSVTVKEGDWISLNGSLGVVYKGEIDTIEPALTGPFGQIMKLADKYRTLGVRTNSDTPHDTEVAVKFGAEGIGLTRTEHMFFEGDRIVSFRRLILVADTVKRLRQELETAEGKRKAQLEAELKAPLEQYNRALKELLPLQRKDFEGIFRALKGRPCTIRLLDPPLHEFLPHDTAGQKAMADNMGVELKRVKELVDSLHEFNPMLGHRGCRLGITYPEVTRMQARAIIEAALKVRGARPEIMVPLVGTVQELALQKQDILDEIEKIKAERKMKTLPFEVLIGTMIEIPRAAVTADEIAKEADFFSFGTNDLTQMGCGFSRDDAGRFLGDYVQMGIYEYDPFQVLDQAGIGKFVDMACKLGRQAKPGIKLGICGEHGGEPKSVEFCHRVGLSYVSCSPFRVPIARLAAAQAAIKDGGGAKTKTKKTAKKKATKKRK